MNFAEAEAYLYSLGNEVEAMKLGLDNIRKLLADLGNPETKYLKVQVAGTNGKGSVCAFLNSICLEAGIKIGLYTSPHLVSVTERVKIDAVEISEDEFARLATRIREQSEKLVSAGELENVPTFFEQVTAIALLAFAEANVDLAILETGLGGRFDAVTAANAEICAITRVDLDHQKQLGETIEEIAAEKAAIIRADSAVYVGRQRPEVSEIIANKCIAVGVRPVTLEDSDWEAENECHDGANRRTGQYVHFRIDGFRYDEVFLSLLGEHQAENAALAILVAKHLPLDIQVPAIFDGLAKTRHPGRMEWIAGKYLIDGAHNVNGAAALANYLAQYGPEYRIVLLFGAMNDKNYGSALELLAPRVGDIILTRPNNPRSADPAEIAVSPHLSETNGDVFVVENVVDAIDAAKQLVDTYPATIRSFVLITGSLYLVGESRKLLTRSTRRD